MLHTVAKLHSAILLAVVRPKATSGTFGHVTTDNEITNQILVVSADLCRRWKARGSRRCPVRITESMAHRAGYSVVTQCAIALA